VRLVCGFVLVLGCGQPHQADRYDVTALQAAASYRLYEPAGTPIAEALSVVALSPDSVLVLDAAESFLHLYGKGGDLRLETARKGGGPGEFLRPGFARLFGDTLWVMDWGPGRLVRWRLDTWTEMDRVVPPPHVIDIIPACGGRVTVVYAGVKTAPQEQRAYGIALFDGESWDDRSQLRHGAGAITLSWPDARVTMVGDSAVALYDWSSSHLLLLGCNGKLHR
jgi:hypothetical protein